jgi:hypothetical protein
MDWGDLASVAFPVAALGNAPVLGGISGAGGMGGIGDWLNGRSNVPQIGANPYQGDWTSLIRQLQQTAAGNGPSLAGNAYKQAASDAMRNAGSMAGSGSAGGQRQAQYQMGLTNQGLAQGYANARLQEQLGAQQMLSGALQGGGNAWFQPQQANLNATMSTPTHLQQLMGFLSQLGGSGSAMSGSGGGAGAGMSPTMIGGMPMAATFV